MKTFIAFLVVFLSVTANAAPLVSPEVSRACAELMGDVVYFQVDNSARARERVAALLEKTTLEAAQGRAPDDALATSLVGDVKKLHQSQINRSPYDVEQYKNIVDSYERIIIASRPEASNDSGFLVLDLRYRYLSKTLAAVKDGTIASAPLLRSLEDSYADVERAMNQPGAKRPVHSALRKWSFLRSRVLDYNSVSIPALANNMTLKIASEMAGVSIPVVATSRH